MSQAIEYRMSRPTWRPPNTPGRTIESQRLPAAGRVAATFLPAPRPQGAQISRYPDSGSFSSVS